MGVVLGSGGLGQRSLGGRASQGCTGTARACGEDGETTTTADCPDLGRRAGSERTARERAHSLRVKQLRSFEEGESSRTVRRSPYHLHFGLPPRRLS